MNKFIEYDIHNGVTQIRCAIMNILTALDSMEIDSYEFSPWISSHLVIKCMTDSGWYSKNGIWYSPTKRDFIFIDDIKLELVNYENYKS